MFFRRSSLAFFQFLSLLTLCVLGIGQVSLNGEVLTEYDFESGLQGWSNLGGSFGWQRDSGGTPSSSTGPSIDATGNSSGYYVYMETSSGSGPYTAGQESYFVSPSMLWENSELEFAYHMYGSTMGTLNLEVSTDSGSTWTSEWSITGQQHTSSTQAYTTASVDLTSYSGQTLQLRFRGESTVTGYQGDMAIDAVKVIRVEPPALSLIADREFLEGSSSIPATLSVSAAQVSDLVVDLSGDAFLSFPASVTIPAGQSSVDFNFAVLDDSDVQGDRSATITASATDYTSGVHNLTVYDDESPYTVTFDLDGKGTLDSGELLQSVMWGQAAVEPAVTANVDWYFAGWDLAFSNVTADLAVTAQYLPTHTVTFDLGVYGTRIGGGELSQKVLDGKSALIPEIVVDDGWALQKWSQSFTNVHQDLTVTAEYLDEALTGISYEELVQTTHLDYTKHGWGVAVDGDTAAVSSFGGQASGEVHVYVYQDGIWQLQSVLRVDGAGYDFGCAVDLSGDEIVVGANGSAYVFSRAGSSWNLDAKLSPDGQTGVNGFGHSLSIDLKRICVGAYSSSAGGLAFTYVKVDGVWQQESVLSPDDAISGQQYGYSVCLSGDFLAVGSPNDSSNLSLAGSVYLYEWSGSLWVLKEKLEASDSVEWRRFGLSVSLFGDRLLVGAPVEDAKMQYARGYLYAYDGMQWNEVQVFQPDPESFSTRFGESVVIHGDYIGIGAFGEGAVYLYHYEDVSSNWLLREKITRLDGDEEDWFGFSVSFSGHHLLVGAPYHNSDFDVPVGEAYAYDVGEPPHTVTFELGSHGLRSGGGDLEQTVISGEAAIPPEVSAVSGWYFSGWDLDYSFVNGDLAINALYVPTYTVTFDLGAYGALLSGNLVQEIGEGYSAIAPEFDVDVGWFFDEWDIDFSSVQSDLMITAQYLPIHTVTFDLGTHASRTGGGELSQAVIDGQTAVAPTFDVTSDVIFIGWDVEFSSVMGDLTVAAQYIPVYTVTFDLGACGSLLTGDLVQQVGEGYAAIAPEISVSDGWSFVGWDQTYHDVIGTLTVTAQYVPSDLASVLEDRKLLASDGAGGDYFGRSVSVSGDMAVVGAYGDDENGSYGGSAYVYVRRGGVWTEESKLTASGGVADDRFGTSVSVSGDTAVVGAPYDDDNGSDSGSAYVYVRRGGVWTEESKLRASDGAAYDNFATSVSVGGDTAVVGAYRDDDHGAGSGSAYVYVRSGGVWTEASKLTAGDGAAGDRFGYSVSVSGDNAVVGAPYDGDNGSYSGSAYIFDLGVALVRVDFDLDGKAVRTGGGALSQLVKVNTAAEAPVLITNSGFMFDSWDSDFSSVTSDLTVTGLFLDSTTSDGDPLWDGWEQKYLGGTGVSDGSIDSDGDGDLDEDEFKSGNDPMDRADYFHVMEQAVSPVDGQVTLRFTTNDDVGSRRYKIWYTDDLQSGSWTILPMGSFAPDAGDYTEKTFAAPGAADAYFFKVEAFIE